MEPLRTSQRRGAVWSWLIAVVLLTGCAARPVPVAAVPPGGPVLVETTGDLPEVRFDGFAHGKTRGAAAVGGQTFLACGATLMSGGTCAGPMCGGVAALMLGICSVAGVGGVVTGAVLAPPGAKVKTAEATLTATARAAMVQQTLKEHVRQAMLSGGLPLAGDEGDPAASERLVVSITRAGTQGQGINAPVQGYLEARARRVRLSDNRELSNELYRYEGERRRILEWSAEEGLPLARMLDRAYDALGRQIVESVYLRYPYPDAKTHAAGPGAMATGLLPEHPRTRGSATIDPLLGNLLNWTPVDSLQPELRWQAFPRDSDRLADPEAMARVTDVRYDLRLAREEDNVPGDLVLEREGLIQPSYTPESPLRPGARYYWTVRARFLLDGRLRLTPWAALYDPRRSEAAAPSALSYRFRTP